MPKKATFDHTHPTLRKPINIQKKQKFHVTLRERPFSSISNITPLGTVATPDTSNIDFIENREDTTPKYISSFNKASRPIYQPTLHNTFNTSDNNNIDYSNNRDIFKTSEDTINNLQNYNFDDDFSFLPLKPTSSAIDSFNSDDDEYFHKDNDFAQNTNDSKRYYDINTKLPEYTGDGGPYFSSLTTMWIFIWFIKNNIGNIQYFNRYLLIYKKFYFIGTNAYQELVKIIRHPEFKADQVPYSVTTLKEIRNGLPLLPITGKLVPINLKDTPSKTSPFKEAYTFSIKDHIHRIINNPMLMPKMYFGPGVEKEKNIEIWHGDLWKESPLFGETAITINNGQ